MRLISELKRRNVFRMAVLYVVAAWLIMQVAEVVIGLADLPTWTGKAILGLLALGFPIALVLSWFYELTPEGISLEEDEPSGESTPRISGRRIDVIVIALLGAAVLMFAWDKWWTGPPPEKSIAVLPFENMSADPEQEYFSDGISEELLNLLAQLPELRVISRSSSFSFKGEDIAVPEIAAQLNVAHVLEGSVRKMGDRVRITAQLIEAESDSHLWSDSFDRELDDIFAVQNEIAMAISDALKVELALVAGNVVQPGAIETASTDAYDAFLKGRELLHLRDNLREAVRQLEHSLRLDDSFAPAHAQLAIAHALMSQTNTYNQVAVAHLDRAQALAPDLAEAHGGRAVLASRAGDPEATIEHARKALAINPTFVHAMNWMYVAQDSLGRYGEADATLEQLLITDPLSPIGLHNYAELLAQRGQVAEAHAVADRLLQQGRMWAHTTHADISLIYEGKIADAIYWGLKRKRARHGNVFFGLLAIGEYEEARRVDVTGSFWVDLVEGNHDMAIQTTQRNLQLNPEEDWAIQQAAIVMYDTGNIDEALPLLERALNLDVPEDRPMSSPVSHRDTMRLAVARRHAGDEDRAQAAANLVRKDIAARRAAGRSYPQLYEAEALLAAFDDDIEAAVAALESAVQLGVWNDDVMNDRIFEDMWDEPRFVRIRERIGEHVVAEHNKVLQLICFNNPVPDFWRPMPETCDGVGPR
jgi:TolB-like protein/Tfp pilus assembly protein PilF